MQFASVQCSRQAAQKCAQKSAGEFPLDKTYARFSGMSRAKYNRNAARNQSLDLISATFLFCLRPVNLFHAKSFPITN